MIEASIDFFGFIANDAPIKENAIPEDPATLGVKDNLVNICLTEI